MFDLFAELSGLTSEVREHRLVMLRIAEALERLSPPLRAVPDAAPSPNDLAASRPERPLHPEQDPEHDRVHYLAESPEEYMQRISHEADLAISLGVAPWSADFQRTIMEVRAELMKPRRYQDEQGNWQTRPELTAEEADQAVRDGFRIAKAEASIAQAGHDGGSGI